METRRHALGTNVVHTKKFGRFNHNITSRTSRDTWWLLFESVRYVCVCVFVYSYRMHLDFRHFHPSNSDIVIVLYCMIFAYSSILCVCIRVFNFVIDWRRWTKNKNKKTKCWMLQDEWKTNEFVVNLHCDNEPVMICFYTLTWSQTFSLSTHPPPVLHLNCLPKWITSAQTTNTQSKWKR